MHTEAFNFINFVKKILSSFFKDAKVLDVGSGDINGNNRFLFENCEYIGNDVTEGPNVTIVSRTKDLKFEDCCFDVICSTECFEHDPDYIESLKNIYRMLKPGGLFFFTCASTNRGEHGTRRSHPNDSFGTRCGIEDMQDYYKNLTIVDVNEAIDIKNMFSFWNSYYNKKSCDLYFYGIKNGGNNNFTNLEEYSDYSCVNTKNDLN
jgi:SAM-dependent methyltransferase